MPCTSGRVVGLSPAIKTRMATTPLPVRGGCKRAGGEGLAADRSIVFDRDCTPVYRE